MKYIFFLVLFLSPIIGALDCNAQVSKENQKKIKKLLKSASSNYSEEMYSDALNDLLAAQDLGATLSLEDKLNLARCYYFLNAMEQAYYVYIEISDNLTGDDVFYYARSQQNSGVYADAITWYEKAKLEGANTLQVNDLIEQCKWAQDNNVFNMNVTVNPCAELLGATQSFGIQFFNNYVVYSSADDGAKTDKTGQFFLNLFCSEVKDGNVVDNTGKIFSENLRSPYHVGAICFTSDNKYMYYTKSDLVDHNTRNIMRIYVAEYDGNDWINVRPLTINAPDEDYDCAHPALSLDGNFLYFVSNMPGGYGGKDLYVCERKGPNSFGKPKNLGSTINTYDDEVYPVINRDGKLYFSSRGHRQNFGGLDIYSAEMIDGKWQNVTNMMRPYNSMKDDFCYVMDPNRDDYGFVSTNNVSSGYYDKISIVRPKEIVASKVAVEMAPVVDQEVFVFGADDILMPQTEPQPKVEPEVAVVEPEPVKEPEPVEEPQPVVLPEYAVKVSPYDFKTLVQSSYNGSRIDNAKMVISDAATGKVIVSGTSDVNGKFSLTIDGEYVSDKDDYSIVVSKDGFNEKSLVASMAELKTISQEGITLTPIFNDVVLDDISSLEFQFINDLDSNAKQKLDKLASYLLQNPNITVKIIGHTEAKGNKNNNLDISLDMAQKAKSYVVSKGVNGDQLIPRGYGERYLKNRCHRGLYCDKSQHLINRRVEFAVWNGRK